ncbi:MAG TPA: DinB family protein [Longimicrobiaceae bacterium]|nr:DinB family protein [Longimicrobiaceae bacterium]
MQIGRLDARHVAPLQKLDLDREVPYINSAGQGFQSTIGDILLHVALHGAYHRGQVAAAVRARGGAPVPTDYIAFVRGVPAATRGGAGEG